jgi:hypothetical protein
MLETRLMARTTRMLTDNYKVYVLRKQLSPSHALQRNVAIVLLSRCLIEEFVEEDEGQEIGVVQKVAWGIRQRLNNKVGKVSVRCSRQTLSKQFGY